jgi:hypothetical protein
MSRDANNIIAAAIYGNLRQSGATLPYAPFCERRAALHLQSMSGAHPL